VGVGRIPEGDTALNKGYNVCGISEKVKLPKGANMYKARFVGADA
jgi:hypothetical protein